MKKFFIILIFLCFSFSAFAQKSYDLDVALDSSAKNISTIIKSKENIAVATFFTDSKELSSYISDTMVAKLAKTKTLTVLERNEKKMALVDAEIDYQYSGSVRDNSMVEIGYKLGAKYLVYGSFDQLGDMLQLSVQVVNVESAEIIYLEAYPIIQSNLIIELLGDNKELVSTEDFINSISLCTKKMNAVQRDKYKEMEKRNANIKNKYQTQINEVRQQVKEGWESKAEYEDRINKAVSELTTQMETEIDSNSKAISISYDNQYSMIEIQKDKIINDLKNTTFILNGSSIQVNIGDFNSEASPKFWPVSLKSLDKFVAYTFNGKYFVNEADVKTEYIEVENAKKSSLFVGEISYKLVPYEVSNKYGVYVLTVRVYNNETGSTIVNESIDKEIGFADIGNAVSGKSSYEPVAKKEQNISSNISTDPIKTDVTKETTTNTKKATSTITSTSQNPFDDISNFVVNKCNFGTTIIRSENILFEGKKYNALVLSGNTGKVNGDTWYEAACWANQKMKTFIKNGDTIKFKVLGDGNTHALVFGLEGEATFRFKFKTKKDKVTEIEIPYKKLVRDEWSPNLSFNKQKIKNVMVSAMAEYPITSNKDFCIKIFDVRVY